MKNLKKREENIERQILLFRASTTVAHIEIGMNLVL